MPIGIYSFPQICMREMGIKLSRNWSFFVESTSALSDLRCRLEAWRLSQFLHGMQAPSRILQAPSVIALILQGGEHLPWAQEFVSRTCPSHAWKLLENIYVCAFFYLYLYLSIYLFNYESIYLSIYLSTYLPTYLSIYPSIHPSIYLSMHVSMYACMHVYVCAYIYIYIYVHIYIYIICIYV